jgi:hypothetical protein
LIGKGRFILALRLDLVQNTADAARSVTRVSQFVRGKFDQELRRGGIYFVLRMAVAIAELPAPDQHRENVAIDRRLAASETLAPQRPRSARAQSCR